MKKKTDANKKTNNHFSSCCKVTIAVNTTIKLNKSGRYCI